VALRSVRRHLAELESVRLVTRREKPGKPSLLIIEDPSEKETASYLRNFAGPGEDQIVLPTPDKNVRPYKKEETEEKQNLVNEEQTLSEVGEPERGEERPTRRQQQPSIPKAKREYLAGEMLAVLQDEHSLGYYRKVAETVEPHRVFEALSIVKQMSREGRIRKTKGAAFVSMLERRG
jgi:hypothetical protein